MGRTELQERVKQIAWMHTIDLGGGIVTPGKWPVNPRIVAAFDQIDFRGKKVLDVGRCNGLWSFEAEKRGAAEVHSIDYLTLVTYWCTPGYKLAQRDGLKKMPASWRRGELVSWKFAGAQLCAEFVS